MVRRKKATTASPFLTPVHAYEVMGGTVYGNLVMQEQGVQPPDLYTKRTQIVIIIVQFIL